MPNRVLNKRTGVVHDVPDGHWSLKHEDYEVVGAIPAPTISPSSILVTEPDVTPEPNWMPELPEDMPARAKLIAAGFVNIVAVRLASDAELAGVPGISKATVAKIRKFLSNQ